MRVDRLTARLKSVVLQYQGVRDEALLFADEVVADLAAARQVSVRLAPLTRRANLKRSALHQVAGWLHFHRYVHFANADLDGTDDLLASMHFFKPLADHPEAIPPPMRVFVGPARQPDDLVDLAQELRRKKIPNRESAEAAVKLLADALDLADSASRPATMATLGLAICDRIRLTGRADDEKSLAAAVDLCRAAVESESSARHWLVLGTVLRLQGNVVGDPESADAALSAFQQASIVAGPDELAAIIGNLGISHLERYRARGDSNDLDQAVDLLNDAVKQFVNRPVEHSRAMAQLAGGLRDRAHRDGSAADLDTAVDLAESAVHVLEDADAEDREEARFELALARLARYLDSGESADLDRAFDVVTAADASRGTEWLSLLGDLHTYRLVRDEDAHDLAAAIDFDQRALASARSHHKRAELQSKLAMALAAPPVGTLAKPSGGTPTNIRAIDKAIALLAAAVETASADTHSAYLSNLGVIWHRRFEVTHRSRDLDQAIDCLRRAITSTPQQSSDGDVVRLANFVENVTERWRLSALPADRATIAAAITRSAPARASSANAVRYHRVLGSAALAIGDAEAAVRLLDVAIAGLPTILPRLGSRVDSEMRLTASSGLAAEATEAHCAVGDPAGAVVAVESCRAQMLALRLNVEDDPAALARVGPAAAAAFTLARELLRAAPTDRERWAKFEDAIQTIREQPGLRHFPLPEDPSAYRPAEADQAVVVLTSWHEHGRAIIVPGKGEVVDLRLPGVSRRDAQRHVGPFIAAGPNTGPVLPGLMAWLWAEAVAPVLEVVRDQTGCALPRVWWTPCDLMSLLPVHAAQPEDGPGCLDAAVSSYAPTLRLLRRARATGFAAAPTAVPSILGVSVPHAPGQPTLTGAVHEVEELVRRHPTTRSLVNPNRVQFAAALQGATWLHFAGHAGLNEKSPGSGALHLADGPLPFDAIADAGLGRADLAYLSACSTGQRGWRHADEAMHLASAFHVAGFHHVIASLWPVNDKVARRSAQFFYSELSNQLTPNAYAAALRAATLDMRATFEGRPEQWAPFVHSGP